MERHEITKREYAELHKIVSEKRAVKEILDSLKSQLSVAIIKEDKWWQKIAKKYSLDVQNYMYSIDHSNQTIIGIPRQQQNNQQQQAPQQEQIRVRERTPEMNKLVSPEELEAIRKAREQIRQVNGGDNNDNK